MCTSLPWRRSCCWVRLSLKQSFTIEHESAAAEARGGTGALGARRERPRSACRSRVAPWAMALGTGLEGCASGS